MDFKSSKAEFTKRPNYDTIYLQTKMYKNHMYM